MNEEGANAGRLHPVGLSAHAICVVLHVFVRRRLSLRSFMILLSPPLGLCAGQNPPLSRRSVARSASILGRYRRDHDCGAPATPSLCFAGAHRLCRHANQMATMFMSFCLVTNIGLLIALPPELFSDVLGSQVFLIFCIGLLLYLRRNQALLERERQLALNTVLASHQELLSTTFDGTAIHIHGRIIRADEGFAQLFGLNEADIVYNPLDFSFPNMSMPRWLTWSVRAQPPPRISTRYAENKSRWI